MAGNPGGRARAGWVRQISPHCPVGSPRSPESSSRLHRLATSILASRLPPWNFQLHGGVTCAPTRTLHTFSRFLALAHIQYNPRRSHDHLASPSLSPLSSSLSLSLANSHLRSRAHHCVTRHTRTNILYDTPHPAPNANALTLSRTPSDRAARQRAYGIPMYIIRSRPRAYAICGTHSMTLTIMSSPLGVLDISSFSLRGSRYVHGG